MERVDLHSHTTASDGLLRPDQVIQLAREVGLKAVAITDHDTVSGIEEAQEEGRKLGIKVVPGVEISTLWDGKEIHMLGYYIYPHDPELLKKLEDLRDVRKIRNQMMISKLNQLGIEITLEEVAEKSKRKAPGLNVGRPHIAEVLIDKGVVGSMDEAFDRYLGRDGLAYVTPKRITPFEAIDIIHGGGGVAVIAHPGLYEQDEVIPQLVECGLDGIEVNHPDHTEEAKRRYRGIAEKYHLIATAGSDFHGERNGSMYHAQLGTCTADYSRVKELKQAAGKR
ncbi:PHP domain-containing protein [Paenactinomyces guangxiensis]|uniref:PHP domain-containing protein n=1 Tax=Paenactinomyces guangxiensis TaxID=1490290 RepID=A0A7W1WP19_9BACL|nr:PHP domain-containing protein [Paenactinomyces guangxiensis]MBA4493289.1 PHP domain-containing protein [Paenactinomyces guangxiensis]MBH8589860.1 PHP domain-containing protein [Paenactinomyces guangxiensis]